MELEVGGSISMGNRTDGSTLDDIFAQIDTVNVNPLQVPEEDHQRPDVSSVETGRRPEKEAKRACSLWLTQLSGWALSVYTLPRRYPQAYFGLTIVWSVYNFCSIIGNTYCTVAASGVFYDYLWLAGWWFYMLANFLTGIIYVNGAQCCCDGGREGRFRSHTLIRSHCFLALEGHWVILWLLVESIHVSILVAGQLYNFVFLLDAGSAFSLRLPFWFCYVVLIPLQFFGEVALDLVVIELFCSVRGISGKLHEYFAEVLSNGIEDGDIWCHDYKAKLKETDQMLMGWMLVYAVLLSCFGCSCLVKFVEVANPVHSASFQLQHLIASAYLLVYSSIFTITIVLLYNLCQDANKFANELRWITTGSLSFKSSERGNILTIIMTEPYAAPLPFGFRFDSDFVSKVIISIIVYVGAVLVDAWLDVL